MADSPDKPYMQFNFRVEIDAVPIAAFQEVTGIGTEIATTEYRVGTDADNNVRKLSGLNKVSDVTLKRGVVRAQEIFKWLEEVRTGKSTAQRTLKVMLMSEDRSIENAVLTWVLNNARITKLTYGPLNAKGSDVAMEEMVVAYERLTLV